MKLTIIALVLGITGFAQAKEIHPAAQGCYEVLATELEDGSSYYQAIGDKILERLYQNPDNISLGKYLEDALVNTGHMKLNLDVCNSINHGAF